MNVPAVQSSFNETLKQKENPVEPSQVIPAPTTRGLSPETQVRRREGVVLRQVAGERMLVPTVAREVDLDRLFLLNATGQFVWENLDGSRRLVQLAEAVAVRFGAAQEIALADVTQFLESLLQHHLAEQVAGDGR